MAQNTLVSLVFINSILRRDLFSYYSMLHMFVTTPQSLFNKNLLNKPGFSYVKFLLTPLTKKTVEHPLHYLPKNFNFSKQFFKHYIKLGLYTPSEAYNVHFSYSDYYMYNSGKNLGFLNVKLFFRVWSLFIAFLENLFYYNVSLLAFSNPYLKEESLALSWGYLQFFKYQWRLSNLFYLFTNNKNIPEAAKFFKMLKLKNFSLAIITDITYHHSTTHCLHVNNFVTVGPLPLTMSLYALSFSLPVTANNFVSNLFFLRLTLKVKALSCHSLFNKRKLHWA
jgi:hypothetical protein